MDVDVDVVMGAEGTLLDPDLLQLPELSPVSLRANPFLAEELFSLWLSLPDTNKLVIALSNLLIVSSIYCRLKYVNCVYFWNSLVLDICSFYFLYL